MDSPPSLSHILKQLPSLDLLASQHGDTSVLKYARSHYRVSGGESSPLLAARKEEFLTFMDTYVTEPLGASLSSIAQESLQKNYCVSTAEHHGPMGHPFFFQSAILRGLAHPDVPIINFCTSHVSLGNSSYPRGCVFHGDTEQNLPLEYLHLPFFPASQRMTPVFRLPAYTHGNISSSCFPKLQSLLQEGLISRATYETAYRFLDTYVLTEELLACETYSEQITRLNHTWWKSMFPDLPDFLPLDAEDIVSEILEMHLHSNTTLTRMLTDQTFQPLIEQCFNGISCCFDLARKSGTYLFWYLDENHIRHALWREGNELTSSDRSFRMAMDHEEISLHLRQKHLVPSGLLVYASLACYYGVTCFGGFAQGNYLPRIQEAYRALLDLSGIPDECLSTQPSLLNEDLVFAREPSGQISTALDMYVRGVPSSNVLHENAQSTSVRDALEAMVPEIARCL